MKAQGDKIHINKLVNAPTGLNDLETNVDDLDVGTYLTLVTATALNTKICNNTEIESKIPDTSDLATTVVFNALIVKMTINFLMLVN